MNGENTTPRPDPTALTAIALGQVKDDLRRDIDCAVEVLEEKIGGLRRVVDLHVVTLNLLPEQREQLRVRLQHEITEHVSAAREAVGAEIKRVEDVNNQKFCAIDTQFDERDGRVAQAASEARISLDAALSAAKEAVGEQNKSNALSINKSEQATQKQIDSLETLMQTSFKALEDKYGDLKGRLDRGEGSDSGEKQTKMFHSQAQATIFGWLAAGGGIVTALILAIAALAKAHGL